MPARIWHTITLLIAFWVAIASSGLLHAQKYPPDSSKLLRHWELDAIDNISLPDTAAPYSIVLLEQDRERTVHLHLPADSLAGTWVLHGDTLVVKVPVSVDDLHIDSVAYTRGQRGPELQFFSRGEHITRLTVTGLKAVQSTRHFLVASLEDDRLVLTDLRTGNTLEFTHREVALTGHISFNDVWRGVLGMVVLLFLLYLLSSNRRAIDWKLVAAGISIQLIFAFLVLKVDFVRLGFDFIASFFVMIMSFTYQGSLFLFGDLMDVNTYGYIFAFQVLPTIVFFSALTSILYYLGILQRIVFGFAWVMSRTMRLSGAESLAAAANIFIGQTEAPLVVKPYLERMTKSEILCLMVGGMATIAGGVFAAYIGFLGGNDPVQMQFFATHLLTASIMSAPAAIVAAKMLFPEAEPDKVDRKLTIPKEKIGSNLLDALSNGTTDGLKLAVNVGAMLLTFTALIYMLNHIMLWIGGVVGLNESIMAATAGRFDGLSLDYILGMAMAPMAWVLGTPWEDAMMVGQLLGKKTIVNEFIAYQGMEAAKDAGQFIHAKSIIIATYALCGFANFASIGIQIGGIGVLAPGQRKTLASFGIKALIGGTAAAFLTAVIAGTIV